MSDPKGNKTVYDYTPDGQLEQQVRYAAGQLQQPDTTITYQYHPSGHLASYSDGTHGASYAYTATGQLQSETTQFGPFGKSVAYSYYDNGDLKHYTDPEGRTLEYHYDANRQLEAINLPNVGLYTVNSHRWFAPEQVTLPGGTVQKRSYDGFMQLTGIEVNDPGQNRQMHYQYQYDKVGNITGKATEHGAYVYQYDDLYRLIEAQNPNSATETFTYDPVGNRLTTQASSTPWIYNANHALQSRPEAISYGYDANGSTTQITRNGQTTQLIYNAANRLAEIKDHANQSVATYRYDPFGRRISKTVHGDTTYFLYSPQGLIGEYSATGSLIRGYGYKPGGHWMTDPLYLKTGSTREQHFFYQNDHLGTPQKLMSTTGAIVWDARYEAFGQATPIPLLPSVQPVDNPLRFAGQYHDPETGWHYNWHRYYSPELGRYITSDPIPLKGGMNTYLYSVNNPLSYVDIYGLYGMDFHGRCLALKYLEKYKDPERAWEQALQDRKYYEMNNPDMEIFEGTDLESLRNAEHYLWSYYKTKNNYAFGPIAVIMTLGYHVTKFWSNAVGSHLEEIDENLRSPWWNTWPTTDEFISGIEGADEAILGTVKPERCDKKASYCNPHARSLNEN